MPDIFAGMERELGHYLHRHNHPITIESTPPSPQDQPQEQRMSRITDAKNAIDNAQAQMAGLMALAANPLVEAIAKTGVGQSFTAKDVQLALAMLDAIDKYGPGTNQVLTYGAPQQPEQQQPIAGAQLTAADLQPQQPA